ncbi:MAG: DNA starvation/stationary phase protection protein [Bacilli bacterium]|jgi:starvation-inducible DNA-binding protein|nr:DNA starvation/stationary phase protection protein [Bacilli bacterium]
METEELLNQLLADYMALNVKLHNLHWNVVGMGFEEYHELTEEMYEEMFENFDDIAEYLRKVDKLPLAQFQEYAKITKIKDIKEKEFTDEEVVKELVAIIDYLKASYLEIMKAANEANELGLARNMENKLKELAKRRWMVTARTK